LTIVTQGNKKEGLKRKKPTSEGAQESQQGKGNPPFERTRGKSH